MPETLFCTVVAKNYLAYARALAASLKQHHPEAGFVVFLCDRPDGFALDTEPFPVWTLENLDNIAKRPGFSFKYEITELNTGIKPFLFAKLLEHFQPKKLIYLDPDILPNFGNLPFDPQFTL